MKTLFQFIENKLSWKNNKTKFFNILEFTISNGDRRVTCYVVRQINEACKWHSGIQEFELELGRPAKRWDDDFRLTLGPYWTRAAVEKVRWRQLQVDVNRHIELRDIIATLYKNSSEKSYQFWIKRLNYIENNVTGWTKPSIELAKKSKIKRLKVHIAVRISKFLRLHVSIYFLLD